MSEDIKVTDGTVLETLNNKVDLDFCNVPTNSVGFAKYSTEVTNCLTEVPQRIKYTLENGTLTIKAGSVVIVPYGTEDKTNEFPVGATFLNDNFKVYDTQFADGKFFVWVELLNDLVRQSSSSTTIRTRCLIVDMTTFGTGGYMEFTSGSSDTTSTSANYVHYNTTTNTIAVKLDGSMSNKTVSLPILLYNSDTTYNVASIRQVFNGMGYIGSAKWIDKGVKMLCSDGKNEDGTYKNIEHTTPNLKFYFGGTAQTIYNDFYNIGDVYKEPIGCSRQQYTYEVDYLNQISVEDHIYSIVYVRSENRFYCHVAYSTDWQPMVACKISNHTNLDANGNVGSFNPKQPFRAVDNNDIDGKWVSSLYNIASDVTIANASTLTYDLSSYLPKDSNAYEVYLGFFAKTGTANGNSIEIRIGSSIATIDAGFVCAAQTRAANFITASGIVTIPVGADKIITVKNSGNASGTISLFRAGAYRRLGM